MQTLLFRTMSAAIFIGSVVMTIPAIAEDIHYQRHEYTFPDSENRVAPLHVLVYDIPYFGACGIFPPLHIANELFFSGGSQGGMSPGATWKPFRISTNEYLQLVEKIKSFDPVILGDSARYNRVKFAFDNTFDNVKGRLPSECVNDFGTPRAFNLVSNCYYRISV